MDQNATMVEAPILWPTRCATCPSQKGPMLDTGNEYPTPGGIGRLYLCRQCLRHGARLAGFSKGKEMDRLVNAAEELEALGKDISFKEEMINDLVKQVEDQRKVILS